MKTSPADITQPSELLAAQRDASWYNHPALRAGRYHVVVGSLLPTCNQRGWVLLVEFTAMPASEVPPELRCERPGCAALWPSPD